jgi:hypothetical protein
VRADTISRPEFALFEGFRRESDLLPEIVAKHAEIAEETAGTA